LQYNATGISKRNRNEEEELPGPTGMKSRVNRATKGSDEKWHWRMKLPLEHGRKAKTVWSSKGP
jgi:hypothetical protein